MKMYGRAEEVANLILSKFEAGEIPHALAQRFMTRTGSLPCDSWSWNNQLAMILEGTQDARGFRQWQEAGRKVKKGARSFCILGPITKTLTRKDEETDEKKRIKVIYGFKSIPVFRIEDTEVFDEELWAKATTMPEDVAEFMDSLPLLAVADAWGLTVRPVDKNGHALGSYSPRNREIKLATKNLATWAHELVHAADDKCGNLVQAMGQESTNEIVAEFGGAVVLSMLGYEHEADLGGAWEYIQAYGGQDKQKALSMCMNLIDRTCQAIDKILKVSEATVINQEMAA